MTEKTELARLRKEIEEVWQWADALETHLRHIIVGWRPELLEDDDD